MPHLQKSYMPQFYFPNYNVYLPRALGIYFLTIQWHTTRSINPKDRRIEQTPHEAVVPIFNCILGPPQEFFLVVSCSCGMGSVFQGICWCKFMCSTIADGVTEYKERDTVNTFVQGSISHVGDH